MRVVPAIEEQTIEDFQRSLDKVKDFAGAIHLDFNDGSFENYRTCSPDKIESLLLPLAERIVFEAHLMVQRPFDYVPKLVESGVKKVIAQAEIDDDLRGILEQLNLDSVLVGLAVGPETAIADIEPLLDLVDAVTIMTVYPGRQGQLFLPDQLSKVRFLRENNYSVEIEVDGGVTAETTRLVKESGADAAVVGSYLLKAENPKEKYDGLVKITSP